MKKIFILVAVFLLANFSWAENKENPVRGDFGLNLLYNWNAGNIKNLNLKEVSSLGYEFYASLEHDIIILPNIKFAFSQIGGKDNQSSFNALKNDFNNLVKNGDFRGLDYSHLDLTLYYNLVRDYNPFSIKLGLSMRYYIKPLLNNAGEGLSLTDNAKDLKFMPSDTKDYKVLPLMYTDISFKVPRIDLYFGIEGNFMIFQKSNSLNDWKFSAKYELGFVPIIVPGFELGYRYSGITRNFEEKSANTQDFYSINGHAIFFGIYGKF